jgi:hypothetical protein
MHEKATISRTIAGSNTDHVEIVINLVVAPFPRLRLPGRVLNTEETMLPALPLTVEASLTNPLQHISLFVPLNLPIMSLRTARTAMSAIRNSSASKQRLSQVQRHFSSTASTRQEIQDAYILSASRTPTAKVLPSNPFRNSMGWL